MMGEVHPKCEAYGFYKAQEGCDRGYNQCEA